MNEVDPDILEALLASIPDEVLVYDQSDRLVRWNPVFEAAFCQDTGRAPVEGLQMAEIVRARLTGLGILSPQQIEQEVGSRVAFRDGSDHEYEYAAVGRDAVLHEFSYGDYRVVRLRDARQREEVQQRRVALEETVESLVESHPAAFAYFDEHERLVLWNKHFEAGYEVETSQPLRRYQTHGEIFLNRARARYDSEADAQRAFQLGRKWFLERKTNEVSAAGRESITRRRRTASGGTIVLIQDVTRIKQGERELRRANEALAQANVDLDLFARAASHDLKAPLRAIDGLGAVLVEDFAASLDPEALKLVRMMNSSARRASVLLDDIAEFTRLGQDKGETVELDIQAFVRGLRVDFADLIGGREDALVARGQALLQVNSLVGVILRNLVGNALKFSSPERSVRVEINSQADASATAITVSDNGIGIAPAYQERIFESFQRLHTSAEYEGSGIGLATCRRVAEALGGVITVDSEPGKGSRFTLTVPVLSD